MKIVAHPVITRLAMNVSMQCDIIALDGGGGLHIVPIFKAWYRCSLLSILE